MKGLSLTEANIKIVLVGLTTIKPQAKNIKDDKFYLDLHYEFTIATSNNYFHS